MPVEGTHHLLSNQTKLNHQKGVTLFSIIDCNMKNSSNEKCLTVFISSHDYNKKSHEDLVSGDTQLGQNNFESYVLGSFRS